MQPSFNFFTWTTPQFYPKQWSPVQMRTSFGNPKANLGLYGPDWMIFFLLGQWKRCVLSAFFPTGRVCLCGSGEVEEEDAVVLGRYASHRPHQFSGHTPFSSFSFFFHCRYYFPQIVILALIWSMSTINIWFRSISLAGNTNNPLTKQWRV